MSALISFIAGVFVGSIFSFFCFCILVASDERRDIEKEYEEYKEYIEQNRKQKEEKKKEEENQDDKF